MTQRHNPTRLSEISLKGGAELAKEILATKVEGDVSREQWMWNKWLYHDDQRLAYAAFIYLHQIAHGKPLEKKEVDVNQNTFIAEVPAKVDDAAWTAKYADGPKAVPLKGEA